jgi:ribosomal-protein-alanine N-acetyltransferase
VTLRIREAKDFDLDRIAEIERACFGDPWPRVGFEPFLRAPQSVFIACENGPNDSVCGYCIARWVADEAELLNLAVARDARRQGIGGQMLDATLAMLAQEGVSHVFLEVRDSNAAARELYASRGFHEMATRKGYYRNPIEDAVVLAWEHESAL